LKNIKKYKTILCITPVKHLEGVYEEMSKYGNIIYKPNIKESQLITTLSKNKNINIIYCNPNRQNFRLEKTNLEKSSIKAIFTASTGTNHIDIEYCNSKKIKIVSYKKDKKIINKLPSTSELAVGLMISLIRNIPRSFDSVKKKKVGLLSFHWKRTKKLNYWNYRIWTTRKIYGEIL
jgi:lactate dehydrogenase-like 2-hydroxyacid dehydrogenase